MRLRVLIAAGVVLVMGALLLRDMGGRAPLPSPSPRARAARPAPSARVQPPASDRNVFEFAPRVVQHAPFPRPPAPVVLEPPRMPVPPPPPPVRFVGLVRRGGTLRAALQVHGEPAVVGMGEAAGGYTVIAIDEDGVRLRAADGSVLTLRTGGS